MKFCWLAAALTLLPALAQLDAERAKGHIFEDRNGNASWEADEPGIPNVRVSNGIDVVLSDANGAYSIDVGEAAVLFITKPAGFTTSLNDHMLPQFYYIYQPEGSVSGLRYAGVDPTGPLPENVDFPLRQQSESNQFEAILFADTQPQTSAELDYIRDDVIAELIDTTAVFGMTLGDIMFDDLSLFPRYNAIIAQLRIPWYNVPGNHELNFLAPDDRTSLETFKRYFGPPYYAFEYGQTYFVVLDNIYYNGNGQSDPADYRGNGGIESRFTDEQLQWLKNELVHVPNDRLVFLTMHAPLKTYTSSPDTMNRRELLKLLNGRPHLYAVAGHTHTTEHHYLGAEDGFTGPGKFHHHVLSTVSGSWWSGPIDDRGIAVAEQRDGTPNGYHILEVDGVDLTVRYKAAGKPAHYQMRVVLDVAHHHHLSPATRDFRPGELLDGRLSVDEVAATNVVVNLFDGGPNSKIVFWVEDGAAVEMEPRATIDPYVNELFMRNRDTIKPWVEAIPSSHIYVADLPDDLQPGTYTLTVKATDEFGRHHHAHKILEVMGTSATASGRLRY